MTLRLALLEFHSWRNLLRRVIDTLAPIAPRVAYAFGYHSGLWFSMLAWAAEQRYWEAYRDARDEMRRRGYKSPEDLRV